MAKSTTTFEIKNSLSEIGLLRETLETFCRSAGLPDKGIGDIHLAAEELFANIVLYGFKDKGQHFIRFTLSMEGKTLRMGIEDDGMPFDPVEAEDPDLESLPEDRPVGGLGIFLAKEVMDSVTYDRSDGKNRITLKKVFEDI